jgi:hypothetical protein
MADDDLFKTQRMTLMRGAGPVYIPGQAVFLQRDLQTFTRGTQGKVVSVQSARPGEHRYHVLFGDDKLWVFEADLRPTPPGESPLAKGPDGLTITQRLQTMTVSQRMATLGVDENRRLTELAATQRMHTLTQEERMAELLKTNRVRTIKPETPKPGADAAPASPAPTSGTPPKT